MYTGILGDIVSAAAPTTEADPVGIYASLLAGVGVMMNSTPDVRVGNTRHPLLIWPLLLGRWRRDPRRLPPLRPLPGHPANAHGADIHTITVCHDDDCPELAVRPSPGGVLALCPCCRNI
jgi:hypothetical protein